MIWFEIEEAYYQGDVVLLKIHPFLTSRKIYRFWHFETKIIRQL